jgi:hypothetical protein
MSTLVEELKSDHVQLKQTLKKASDFSKPVMERLSYLKQIKQGLLDHLSKEDRELYPVLKKAAERNLEVRRLVDHFAKDLEEVASQALAFFAKYEDIPRVVERMKMDVQFAMEFGGDLERLMILLGLRIGREEGSLYPEFDKLAD